MPMRIIRDQDLAKAKLTSPAVKTTLEKLGWVYEWGWKAWRPPGAQRIENPIPMSHVDYPDKLKALLPKP